MHASNAARFEAAYKNIADRLQLPGRDDTTVNVLQLVCNWLCSEGNRRWLIILDNADNESFFNIQRHEAQGAASGDTRSRLTLADFLPQSKNGSILITSRNMDVAVKLTGSYKDIVQIQKMSRDQGVELLRKKLCCPSDGQAIELLAALDYIPLAIIQAAAYINKRWPRTTVASYVQELRTNNKKRAKLLNQAMTDLRRDEEASNSILATWQISFEHIRKEKPSAADLLSLMSFFNPQGIPEFLLRDYSGSKPNTKDDDDDGEDGFEDDLDLLRSYLLVITNGNGDVFEMHRLVQFATRTWLRSFGGEDRWRRKFLATLSKEFPTGEFSNWSQCQLLLPHIEPVVDEEPVDAEEAKYWAQVLHNAAWYTWSQGLYIQAEEMIQGSISARARVLGVGYTETLASVIILASVLRDQGKYDEAEQMNLRALEGYEKALGEKHPDTLMSVNNLALVLGDQNKYDEAEQMNRRALEGREKALGEEHPNTLTSVSNLALVLEYQGKYNEAEQMNRRALEGYEKVLGKEHPSTLTSVSNLALVLGDQGKYDEAEQMNRRALEGRERALGEEHPSTLMSVSDLTGVLRDQGKYDKAEQMNRRALEGYEKVLGKEHPDTLTSISSLALVLQDQGKYDEAEQMSRRALEGREKALGEEHPGTLTSVSNLAGVLRDQGKYDEAEQMNRRALEAREKALGEKHPDTLTSVYCLAYLYHQQRRYDAASVMYQRAHDGYKRKLGPNHPTTVACCDHFATMVQEMHS